MNYEEAKQQIQFGDRRARREEWEEEMFIYTEVGKVIPSKVLREPQKSWFVSKHGNPMDMRVESHVNLVSDGFNVVVGWQPDEEDETADDWEVIDPPGEMKSSYGYKAEDDQLQRADGE